MKYKILKTALALGIMTISLASMAQDKNVARFALKGVSSTPTFGMTQSEKQEYLENTEMCAEQQDSYESEVEEKFNMPLIENPEDREKYHYIDGWTYRQSGYSGSNYVFLDGEVVASNGENLNHTVFNIKDGNVTTIYRRGELINSYCLYYTRPSRCGEVRRQYSVLISEKSDKTENYDFCVSNGYKTN